MVKADIKTLKVKPYWVWLTILLSHIIALLITLFSNAQGQIISLYYYY